MFSMQSADLQGCTSPHVKALRWKCGHAHMPASSHREQFMD